VRRNLWPWDPSVCFSRTLVCHKLADFTSHAEGENKRKTIPFKDLALVRVKNSDERECLGAELFSWPGSVGCICLLLCPFPSSIAPCVPRQSYPTLPYKHTHSLSLSFSALLLVLLQPITRFLHTRLGDGPDETPAWETALEDFGLRTGLTVFFTVLRQTWQVGGV
jgi:hypothetical protein